MRRKCLSLLMGCLIAAVATAAEEDVQPAAKDKGRLDKSKSVQLRRSADFIGMTVVNDQQQQLGDVNNVVIDLSSGKIRYVAVESGGKMFAVPHHALKTTQGTEENAETQLLWKGVTQAELEQLQGFEGGDAAKWPQHADEQLARGKEPPKEKPGKAPKSGAAYRITDLRDLDVVSEGNMAIGAIEEFVLDIPKGNIRYAVLQFDPSYEAEDKRFAMPWQVFELKQQEDQKVFVAHVPVAKLKDAPGFSKEQWPDFANREFSTSIEKHYNVTTTKEHERRGDQPRDDQPRADQPRDQ